ncbi:MAG TPA: type II secretion system protein GspE [Myxococcales bacterium]|nr:type II secretion system protein GspE [Myxococcales bacterium]HIN85591.1 type II secretion system protein GspE [Myxococcales bacterium]
MSGLLTDRVLVQPGGRRLGELLIAQGRLTEEQLEQALEIQQQKELRLGEILVEMEVVNVADVTEALAAQVGMPYQAEIVADEIDPMLVSPFSLAYARQFSFVPLSRDEHSVHVAISDPLNVSVIDDLRAVFHREVDVVAAPPDQIFDAINVVFDRRAGAEQVVDEVAADDEAGIAVELEEATKDILDASDDEAPIIRLVNSVLNQAVKEKASDIHVEPFEKEIVIRFRRDGVLSEIVRAPKRLQASITSRIKIMGDLNIAEKRLPQDGRIRIKIAGRDVDMRLSTVPTSHGERLVLRLLDTSAVLLDLVTLGFSKQNLEDIEALIKRPHGIILVTGPTGSGKTTTLYAALSRINNPEINILTIEDPVEYQLDGIGQMQVNTKVGFTFSRGLRAVLRQDPDVVLIGEIRDIETAEIAVQASLTGHLVFATIHTNDAASTFTRLTDMGVEPFLISSSVVATLAQRLVRTLCKKCKTPYSPPEHELDQLGIASDLVSDLTFHKAVGCEECITGYAGRAGIYELLLVDDQIKSLVVQRSESSRIKRHAIERGMRTLRDDGALKVIQGVTSVEEVMRVTAEDLQ